MDGLFVNNLMKKFFKTFFISLLCLIGAIVALLYVTGTDYLIKGVQLTYLKGTNTASIDDWKYFDTRALKATNPEPWLASADGYVPSEKLSSWHKDFQSVAYLVIKDDEIKHEEYWDGYGPEELSNSFSMAKTYTTTLLQMAIQDGHVTSLDQPVGDFLEEFNSGEEAKLTMGHLARMCSGLSWEESYTSPFSVTARSYYSEDLEEIVRELKVVETPGAEYKYLSGNTALLALALTEAIGEPLADYGTRKLWSKTGAEHDAEWVLDKAGGLEKAYCCLASNARDFARMGQLFLDHGSWNGEQLIDSAWVDLVSRGDQVPFYSHGWWVYNTDEVQAFYMRGILGQYVIVLPELEIVVVRLGKKRGEVVNNHPQEVRMMIKEMYQHYGN